MFVAAGFAYVGGAIGLEVISAPLVEAQGRYNLMYLLLTTVEESLELGGIIFFIYALLSYIQSDLHPARSSFPSPAGEFNQVQN